jgi:uncharacterized protein (TIGR02466 family)
MNENFAGHLDLFPVAVAKYRRSDHIQLRQQILDIVGKCPDDNQEHTEEGFLHYYNDGRFPTQELPEFMTCVRSCVSDYAEKFLGISQREFVDLNVWVNSNLGGRQNPHVHNNSLISATYYVQIDPKKHVGLDFHNPKTPASLRRAILEVEPDISTPYSDPFRSAQVEQGDLLIWPSEIMHSYIQPPVDVPRITMSMNFLPEVIQSYVYGFKVSKI